jgi:hypothetical protein
MKRGQCGPAGPAGHGLAQAGALSAPLPSKRAGLSNHRSTGCSWIVTFREDRSVRNVVIR